MASIDFSKLRLSVSLRDYHRVVCFRPLAVIGSRARGRCDACASTDPRCCSVCYDDNVWKCHRCGKAGGVLEWHMERTGFGLYAAALSLCALMGIDVPYLPRTNARGRRPRRKHWDGLASGGEEEVQLN